MIGTIRKHSKVLWWFIVVVVIITFVIFFSPNQPSFGGQGPDRGRGTVYGRTIRQDEYNQALRLARLDMMIRGQGRGASQELEVRNAYQILFLREKFRQLGIEPGDEAVAAHLRDNLKDPQTGSSLYDTVVSQIRQQGFTEVDYIELQRFQLSLMHLADLVNVPAGLVTPREARMAFLRENEQAITAAVFFSSTNHLATIEVTPEALGEFFTSRMAAYRNPEKKRLLYVKFANEAHLERAQSEIDQRPELKAQMEAFYEQQGPDAFRDDDDQVMDREAALARMLESQVENVAANLARQAAIEFYNELARREVDVAGFVETAAEQGLEVQEMPPLSALDFAGELSEIRNFGQILTQLRVDQPISEPVTGFAGAYLIALKEVVPSAVPSLDAVRDRVTEDFRRSRAMEAVRAEGEIFRVIATNALAGGKDFVTVAAEQGHAAVELPPLTLAGTTVPGLPPQADLSSLKNTAFALDPGQLSEFMGSRDGGYLLYLIERRPPAEESVRAALSSYREEMQERNRQRVFATWFEQELTGSGIAGFLDRNLGRGDDE